MKKIISFIVAILLFFVTVFCYKVHMDNAIKSDIAGMRNYRSYERYWSSDTMKMVIEDNTLPLFGSSELVELSDYHDKVESFLNGPEMNIVTIGGGFFQSLEHAIELGAIDDSLTKRKVAISISAQWFGDDGISGGVFASRMSEDELIEFLLNDKISKENKEYLVNRALSLLEKYPTQRDRVKRYKKAFKNPFSIDYIYTRIMNAFWNFKAEYGVYKQVNEVNHNLPSYNLSELDFEEILELAEEQGKQACTNNDFAIYDDYWSEYLVDLYEKGEVENKIQKFSSSSPEYDDLRCFLNVAKDLDIEVCAFVIPVNGKWYNFQGNLCDKYYRKINNLLNEYDNVTIYDFSIYENEPYFLKDIMHLGWKGWTRVNEGMYEFFMQE